MRSRIIQNTLKAILVFVFIVIIIFSIFHITSPYSILSINDLLVMIEGAQTPAITIPDTDEKYFNKWYCFDFKNIEISEGEILYGGSKEIVPLIDVVMKSRKFQFNIDPTYKWDTKRVTKSWKQLIKEQKSICIFAARLQIDPDQTLVLYIDKIKTRRGYWNSSDYLKFVTQK